MKTKALLAGTALSAVMWGAMWQTAHATLQIAFTDGSSVVTCADGQSCDLGGQANNIIILNETVGNFHIIGTVAASQSGVANNLQLSTSLIQNSGGAGNLGIVVGDTNFAGPVNDVRESASLTFNSAIGSGASTLNFFADPANGQPGGISLNAPGTLLFTTSGTPATDPDSFSGTHNSPFFASGPFSMSETANLALAGGASLTGFNESMASNAIPEPSTWAMLALGFGGLAFLGARRARKDRLASLA